jgi:hypothetical protein
MTLIDINDVTWYWTYPAESAEISLYHLARGTRTTPPPFGEVFIAACTATGKPYERQDHEAFGDLPPIPHCLACQRYASHLDAARCPIRTHPLAR